MVDLNRSVSAKYTMEQSQASGMAGLQQLASFGRFGANVLHECQVAALREIRAETVRPSGFNLAAASISSFYSWAARQPQHTVSFQSTSRTPPAPLKHQAPTLTQIRMYLDSQEQAGNMKTVTPSGQDEVAQAGVEQKVSKNSSGRLAVKRSNKKKHLRGNNQHVELPCVFTMQGISINTCILEGMSWRAPDGTLVRCFAKPSSQVHRRDLYIDSATMEQDNTSSVHSRANTSGCPQPDASSTSSLHPAPAEKSSLQPSTSSRWSLRPATFDTSSLQPLSSRRSLQVNNASEHGDPSPTSRAMTPSNSAQPSTPSLFPHLMSHGPVASTSFVTSLQSVASSRSLQPVNASEQAGPLSTSRAMTPGNSAQPSPLSYNPRSMSYGPVASTSFDSPLQPAASSRSLQHDNASQQAGPPSTGRAMTPGNSAQPSPLSLPPHTASNEPIASTSFDSPLQPFSSKASQQQHRHATGKGPDTSIYSTTSSRSGAFNLHRHSGTASSTDSDTVARGSSGGRHTRSIKSLLLASPSPPVIADASAPQHPKSQHQLSNNSNSDTNFRGSSDWYSRHYLQSPWPVSVSQSLAICAEAQSSSPAYALAHQRQTSQSQPSDSSKAATDVSALAPQRGSPLKQCANSSKGATTVSPCSDFVHDSSSARDRSCREVSTSYDNRLWSAAATGAPYTSDIARSPVATATRSGTSAVAESSRAATVWRRTFSNAMSILDEDENEDSIKEDLSNDMNPKGPAAAQLPSRCNVPSLRSRVSHKHLRRASTSEIDMKPCHASLWHGRYINISDDSLLADSTEGDTPDTQSQARAVCANNGVTADGTMCVTKSQSNSRSGKRASLSTGSRKQHSFMSDQENVQFGLPTSNRRQLQTRREFSNVTNCS